MSAVEFSVENGPGPRLVGPDEAPPPPEGPSQAEAEASETGQLALAEWTPHECAAMTAALFTSVVGVAFVVRQWRLPDPAEREWEALAASGAEFPLCGMALAPLANRWLPKSGAGGLVPAAVGAVGGAGEVAIATVRRLPLLLQPRRRRGEAPRNVSEPRPSPDVAPEPDLEGGKFKFPDYLREVVG